MITKYKFCLWKIYFDTGYGITSIFKYIIGLVGLGGAIQGMPLSYLLYAGIAYAIACFFIGWGWFHFGFVDASAEVGNNFNPFARQVRSKLKIKSSYKKHG